MSEERKIDPIQEIMAHRAAVVKTIDMARIVMPQRIKEAKSKAAADKALEADRVAQAHRDTAARIKNPLLAGYGADLHATLRYMLDHPDLLLSQQKWACRIGFALGDPKNEWTTYYIAMMHTATEPYYLVDTAFYKISTIDLEGVANSKPYITQHGFWRRSAGVHAAGLPKNYSHFFGAFFDGDHHIDGVVVSRRDEAAAADHYLIEDETVRVYKLKAGSSRESFQKNHEYSYGVGRDGYMRKAGLSGNPTLEQELNNIFEMLPLSELPLDKAYLLKE